MFDERIEFHRQWFLLFCRNSNLENRPLNSIKKNGQNLSNESSQCGKVKAIADFMNTA